MNGFYPHYYHDFEESFGEQTKCFAFIPHVLFQRVNPQLQKKILAEKIRQIALRIKQVAISLYYASPATFIVFSSKFFLRIEQNRSQLPMVSRVIRLFIDKRMALIHKTYRIKRAIICTSRQSII